MTNVVGLFWQQCYFNARVHCKNSLSIWQWVKSKHSDKKQFTTKMLLERWECILVQLVACYYITCRCMEILKIFLPSRECRASQCVHFFANLYVSVLFFFFHSEACYSHRVKWVTLPSWTELKESKNERICRREFDLKRLGISVCGRP